MLLLSQRLTPEQLTKLAEMSKTVRYTDAKTFKRRMGESGRLSIYRYSKWLTWGLDNRTEFKSCFPPELIKGALIGWFLDFPVITGFLDRITTWVNDKVAGYIVTYNVSETPNIIYIDDEPVTVEPGQAICFSLKHVHEIKPSKERGTWASIMLQGPPLDWTDECTLFKCKK